MATVRAGSPLNVPIQSNESTIIVAVDTGFDVSLPRERLPLGATPVSDNYIVRDGALEPRPTLSLLTTGGAQAMGPTPILGMFEAQSVQNLRFPIASGRTRHESFNLTSAANVWSLLSYVSAAGVNDPPNLTSSDYWDYAQIYSAEADENVVYMAAGSRQSMYVTAVDSTVFSTMTGAPQARFVASVDNYVLAFNTREAGNNFVNRVQWNDRGSASSWTGGLSGFEDLLSMRGEGTRIIANDNNTALLFSDEEVWQGVPGGNVFVWAFAPYDISRGAPFSWTITKTPLGTMFLGKDYQVYLLPKGGGPSQPIGVPLHREIRRTISQPGRAWAQFDNTYGQYQLYYPVTGGSGYPQRAAYLDVLNGSWMPQSFDSAGGRISLTRGAELQLSSSATTWGGLLASGITWGGLFALGQSWGDLLGVVSGRAMAMGSSNGTVYVMNSTGTNDAGTAMPCRWQSGGPIATSPQEQKTVNEFRVDYEADSTSHLTVRFSQDQGNSFVTSVPVPLPTASQGSQGIGYPYFGCRYPVFDILSEGYRHRLSQFYITHKQGGR